MPLRNSSPLFVQWRGLPLPQAVDELQARGASSCLEVYRSDLVPRRYSFNLSPFETLIAQIRQDVDNCDQGALG
jgi:hypothetical protein